MQTENVMNIIIMGLQKIPRKLLFESVYDWIGAFIMSVGMIYIVPLQDLLIAVYGLLFFDFIFGAWHSVKKFGWRSFTYRGILESVGKVFGYTMVLIATYVFQSFLKIDEVAIYTPVWMVAGLIAYAEIKSIVGHFEYIFSIKIMSVFDNIRIPDWMKPKKENINQ